MDTTTTICVLLCVDNNYLPQAGVAVFSLAEHNLNVNIDIHLASSGCDTTLATSVFQQTLNLHPKCSITYIDIPESLLSDLATTAHLSKAVYTRVIAGRLVGPNYQRVIYIDADILICGDILALWQTPLDGAVAAAVREPFNTCLAEIGFTPAEFYFNSGVLLIDLVRWREEDCEARLVDYLYENADLPWMDQDALNIVLRGRIKPLGIEWNYQPRCADVPAAFIGVGEREYWSLRTAPKIIHFTTSLKPWNAAYRVHYSDRYFAAVARAGLGALLTCPAAKTISDRVAALKTKLRWRVPRAFRTLRQLVRPGAAADMYRAGPDARKPLARETAPPISVEP